MGNVTIRDVDCDCMTSRPQQSQSVHPHWPNHWTSCWCWR